MELGSILFLSALAYGFYKLSQRGKESQDSYYKTKYEDEKEKNSDLQDEVEDLNNKINPNENEHQPELSITGSMVVGGVDWTHGRIVLYVTNNSKIDVEIGDFKGDLYMGGYKSLILQPANIAQFTLAPGETKEFTLYARGGNVIQDAGYVYDAFVALGLDTWIWNIPIEYTPVELDLAFLWFWKGGYEQVRVYGVPCSFEYGGAGWTVGVPWKGYNRAFNQAAGSLWNAIEREEENVE